MLIHTYASRAHYWDHLAPIIDALPAELVGDRMSPRSTDPWGTTRPPLRVANTHDLVLVAADADSRRMARNRVIYVEHGAGQTYEADPAGIGHGSYSGGRGHEHTALFVCPSETVADRWRAHYPAIPAAAVGCPKLDRWANVRRETSDAPTVAFSFHWDNPLCLESRSALPFWRPHLEDAVDTLRSAGLRVIGHGHPRARNDLWRLWRALDVPSVADQATVLRLADVFVADNTSALPEHAAVGTPIVFLNAPWYRVDVHHGGRFWEWPEGQIQVDRPDQLVDAIHTALADPVEIRRARERMVRSVYGSVDGRAADRAVAAILTVV